MAGAVSELSVTSSFCPFRFCMLSTSDPGEFTHRVKGEHLI